MTTIFGTNFNDNGTNGHPKLTGTGASDTIYGLNGDDILLGKGSNDTLHGGLGDDVMKGGAGNDTYYVDSYDFVFGDGKDDKVIENVDQGIDKVYSSVSYGLSANVENLELSGSAFFGLGNSLDNNIKGNSANNSLFSYAGADTLDGGAGIDTLTGGTGNDTYYVNAGADIVMENANAGIDSVISSSNFYDLNENIENLSLADSATAERGYGNTTNNTITGNSYANELFGFSGSDRLIGGGGSDYLSGGTNNDRLTGYGYTSGEYDTLSGGTGVDTFVLGKDSDHYGEAFYTGAGYATIEGWEAGVDKIEAYGSSNAYWLDKSANFSGSAALDTVVKYGVNSNIIAVVEDTTSVTFGNFVFV